MMIRLEEKKDYREVEYLTREAFWNVYRPGCMEHLVLHNLRHDACFVPELDYVIEKNGEIIAHIAYAKEYLTKADGDTIEILLFGPVSVLPKMQGQGFGTQLIQFTLNKAEKMGFPAVVITGNPDYYHRFGFESASRHGIFYKGMKITEEAPFFMVKILNPVTASELKGVYSDPICYLVDEQKVDEFDKQFPIKLKEKRPGQL